jgi:hypothetical protein
MQRLSTIQLAADRTVFGRDRTFAALVRHRPLGYGERCWGEGQGSPPLMPAPRRPPLFARPAAMKPASGSEASVFGSPRGPFRRLYLRGTVKLVSEPLIA